MMKKIVFFLLIIPAFCFGQNKKSLSHFCEIPWGTSIEQVESILRDRNLEVFRANEYISTLAYYEGEKALIVFMFNRINRFYSGNVIYASAGIEAIEKYQNYRLVLFRRYGMPDMGIESFAEPYKKGDGREVEAISTENAFYFTEWQFQDNCLASVSILNNLDICLSFINPVYADSGIGQR